MRDIKHLVLEAIALRAAHRIAELSSVFVGADSEAKETALAELEFQRWVLEVCRDCPDGS